MCLEIPDSASFSVPRITHTSKIIREQNISRNYHGIWRKPHGHKTELRVWAWACHILLHQSNTNKTELGERRFLYQFTFPPLTLSDPRPQQSSTGTSSKPRHQLPLKYIYRVLAVHIGLPSLFGYLCVQSFFIFGKAQERNQKVLSTMYVWERQPESNPLLFEGCQLPTQPAEEQTDTTSLKKKSIGL